MRLQSFEQTNIAEEYVVQLPFHSANTVSVVQPAELLNGTPIVHSMPVQSDGFVQNIDPATSLYIYAPAPFTIQIPSNETTMQPTVVEIPLQNDSVTNMVSGFILFKFKNKLSLVKQKSAHNINIVH